MKIMRNLLCSILFAAILTGCAKSPHDFLLSGNSAYSGQNYSAASDKYASALQRNSSNAKAAYNAGCASYKSNAFSEAKENFTSALKHSNSRELSEKANFNLGNSLYRISQSGKNTDSRRELLEKALDAYSKAIEINNSDTFAVKNYYFVKRALDELSNQQNSQKGNNNSDKNSANNQNNSGSNSDKKDKQEQNSSSNSDKNNKDGKNNSGDNKNDKSNKNKSNSGNQNNNGSGDNKSKNNSGQNQNGSGNRNQNSGQNQKQQRDAEKKLSDAKDQLKKESQSLKNMQKKLAGKKNKNSASAKSLKSDIRSQQKKVADAKKSLRDAQINLLKLGGNSNGGKNAQLRMSGTNSNLRNKQDHSEAATILNAAQEDEKLLQLQLRKQQASEESHARHKKEW